MRRVAQTLLQLFFPQRMVCHACGTPLSDGEGLLCAVCEKTLAQDALAPERATVPSQPFTVHAAAAFGYQGTAAALVKALKFHADHTAALPLAAGMAGLYAEMHTLQQVDFCVPVPVHARRLRQRGYNQAEVLATAFAQITGVKVESGVLTRQHHKPSQVGQNWEGRRLNVAGAFAVSAQGTQAVKGRYVLLMDDVLTTGATVEECARVLLAAGACGVSVLAACWDQ